MSQRKFKVWRGDSEGGEFKEYEVECGEGMVVLDATSRPVLLGPAWELGARHR